MTKKNKNNIKQRNYFIITTIIMTILFTITYVSFTKEKAENDSLTDTILEYAEDTDASEFRESFIEGCLEAEGEIEDCNCMYSYMERKMTKSEIIEMSLDYLKDDSEIPEVLYDAVDYCY